MRQPDQYYNTKLAGHALNRKLITKNKHLRQCVAINVFYGCCLQVSFSNKIKRLQKKIITNDSVLYDWKLSNVCTFNIRSIICVYLVWHIIQTSNQHVLAKLMMSDCVITVKTVLAVIQNTLKTGQLSKLHQSILKYQ